MRRALIVQGAALLYFAAWGFGFAAEPTTRRPAPDGGRLDVGASWGPDGGRITSQSDRGDGTKVLHGVQVSVGPQNWLKEYAVYNNGILEQRTQFYPSGRMFRCQRREQNGDGYEVVYAPEADQVVAEGKAFVQKILCQGMVRDDKRWEGDFLVWAPIPNGFGLQLAVHEYQQGKLIKSLPVSAKKLGLPESITRHAGWLWDSPDWPDAR